MKTLLPRTTVIALLVSSTALFSNTVPAADAAVEARLDARGVKYEIDADGDYKITVGYKAEDRTQLVFISGKTETVKGFVVREVFSPAGKLEADGIDGMKALELMAESRTTKLGSWEIAGDVLYFVIKLPDSVDAATLDAAIEIAAEVADNMEIKLSGDRDDL